MEWYSGPGVVAWLETNFIIKPGSNGHDEFGKEVADAIRKWRTGRTVTLWAVDRVLTKMDRHVDELPDEVVVRRFSKRFSSGKGEATKPRKPSPPPRGGPPSEVLHRAFERKVPEYVLAKEYGMSRKFIHRCKEEWENARVRAVDTAGDHAARMGVG